MSLMLLYEGVLADKIFFLSLEAITPLSTQYHTRNKFFNFHFNVSWIPLQLNGFVNGIIYKIKYLCPVRRLKI